MPMEHNYDQMGLRPQSAQAIQKEKTRVAKKGTKKGFGLKKRRSIPWSSQQRK